MSFSAFRPNVTCSVSLLERRKVSKWIFVGMVLICGWVVPDGCFGQLSNLYSMVNGRVEFVSKAELETISASSKALQGVLDPISRSIAFRIANSSFIGFNSQLQQNHFNENYLETDVFPNCTFKGKIIDEVDFKTNGKYPVRVKGILTIKGVSQERIISGIIYIKEEELFISSDFWVRLVDYDIRIPRIVQQKIAPEVQVFLEVKMKFQK